MTSEMFRVRVTVALTAVRGRAVATYWGLGGAFECLQSGGLFDSFSFAESGVHTLRTMRSPLVLCLARVRTYVRRVRPASTCVCERQLNWYFEHTVGTVVLSW